jgi:hypothetical protein
LRGVVKQKGLRMWRRQRNLSQGRDAAVQTREKAKKVHLPKKKQTMSPRFSIFLFTFVVCNSMPMDFPHDMSAEPIVSFFDLTNKKE